MNEDTLSEKHIDTNSTLKFLKEEGQKLDKVNKKYADFMTDSKHAKILYKTMDSIMTNIEYELSPESALDANAKQHEKWLKDFYGNANMADLITKPQALKDMHAWHNYYSSEWQNASANYPHIGKDLPRAIKHVENLPYYWLQRGSNDDGDYVPEPVDDADSNVDEVIENLIDDIKQNTPKECTVKTINELTAYHNQLYNTAFGKPVEINNCMKKIISIIDNLNGVSAVDRLKYFHVVNTHTAEHQLKHAIHWASQDGELPDLALQLSRVANNPTHWFVEDIHREPTAWYTNVKINYSALRNSGVIQLISDIGADLIKTEPVHSILLKKSSSAKTKADKENK